MAQSLVPRAVLVVYPRCQPRKQELKEVSGLAASPQISALEIALALNRLKLCSASPCPTGYPQVFLHDHRILSYGMRVKKDTLTWSEICLPA